MRLDILTLFPEFFDGPLQVGLLGKALQQGIAQVSCINPRDFATDKHRRVDDEPYGGGVGMVLKPEPFFAAVGSLPRLDPCEIVLLTPQGQLLNQELLLELAQKAQLIVLCGQYEGFDERIRQHLATREISLGDFVLTGGEIPALALINGVVRLLPGTVGKVDSLKSESFESGLLEYPQYTRPPKFQGHRVPDVLLSGDHQAIARWRQQQQLVRTWQRRPDLLAKRPLSPQEQQLLETGLAEQHKDVDMEEQNRCL